jgi:hypothetical protein
MAFNRDLRIINHAEPTEKRIVDLPDQVNVEGGRRSPAIVDLGNLSLGVNVIAHQLYLPHHGIRILPVVTLFSTRVGVAATIVTHAVAIGEMDVKREMSGLLLVGCFDCPDQIIFIIVIAKEIGRRIAGVSRHRDIVSG